MRAQELWADRGSASFINKEREEISRCEQMPDYSLDY